MGDTVLYEREGHIATITYNRPEAMNAINPQLRGFEQRMESVSGGRRRVGWHSYG